MTSQGLFDWLVLVSWQAGVLVLLVLLVQRLGRRWLGPRLRYLLWLPVFLRLIVPPVTLPGVNPFPAIRTAAPIATVPISAADWSAAPIWRGPLAHAATVHSAEADNGTLTLATVPHGVAPEALRSAPVPPRAPFPASTFTRLAEPSTDETWPWTGIILASWLIGIVATALWYVVGALLLARRLQGLQPVIDERLQACLDAGAADLGVPVPVLLAEPDGGPPFLTGIRRPKLVVEPQALVALDDLALTCVFRHELLHLRHRDLHANLGLALLDSLFWFHPLVRLAIRRFQLDREAVRDEQAVRSAGSDPTHYCRTLLSLAVGGRSTPRLAGGFLGTGSDHLHRRITMLLSPRRSRLAGITLTSTTLLLATWVGFTAEPPAGAVGARSAADSTRAPFIAAAAAEPLPIAAATDAPAAAASVADHTSYIIRLAPHAGRVSSPGLLKTVTVDFQDKTLTEMADLVAKMGGVAVTIDPAVLAAPQKRGSLQVQEVQIERLVGFISRTFGVAHEITDSGVLITAQGKAAVESRAYLLEPWLRSVFASGEVTAAEIADFESDVNRIIGEIIGLDATRTQSYADSIWGGPALLLVADANGHLLMESICEQLMGRRDISDLGMVVAKLTAVTPTAVTPGRSDDVLKVGLFNIRHLVGDPNDLTNIIRHIVYGDNLISFMQPMFSETQLIVSSTEKELGRVKAFLASLPRRDVLEVASEGAGAVDNPAALSGRNQDKMIYEALYRLAGTAVNRASTPQEVKRAEGVIAEALEKLDSMHVMEYVSDLEYTKCQVDLIKLREELYLTVVSGPEAAPEE